MHSVPLPDQFIQRLAQLLPSEQVATVMHSFAARQKDSFRVNTLLAPLSQTIATLTTEGFVLSPISWYPEAFYVENRSVREFTETDVYKNGSVYIQNGSSMLPVLVLDPQRGERILDVAAAPGSKTTQIAMHMENSGEIVANDVSRERLFKLKGNLKSQGVTNTTITQLPGEQLWKKYPEYFDRTLVDAPCSMEGRIMLGDPKSYADWSLKRIKSLAVRQQYLLRGAVTATRPGGVIVYSTCTLAPEENEGVINWLLEKEGDAISLEQVTLPHVPFNAGITTWGKPYDPRVAKTARIFPSERMEGFFVAKIRKHKTTLPLPAVFRKVNQRRHR